MQSAVQCSQTTLTLGELLHHKGPSGRRSVCLNVNLNNKMGLLHCALAKIYLSKCPTSKDKPHKHTNTDNQLIAEMSIPCCLYLYVGKVWFIQTVWWLCRAMCMTSVHHRDSVMGVQGNVQCCVTGPAFACLLQQPNAALVEAVMQNSVAFTRMQSHQKSQVIELLSSTGLHQNIAGQQRHIPVSPSAHQNFLFLDPFHWSRLFSSCVKLFFLRKLHSHRQT